jgi:hypothetical protein
MVTVMNNNGIFKLVASMRAGVLIAYVSGSVPVARFRESPISPEISREDSRRIWQPMAKAEKSGGSFPHALVGKHCCSFVIDNEEIVCLHAKRSARVSRKLENDWSNEYETKLCQSVCGGAGWALDSTEAFGKPVGQLRRGSAAWAPSIEKEFEQFKERCAASKCQ